MRSRLWIVVFLFAAWVVGIGARLWFLQVDRHDYYRERAADQQRRVFDLEPPRGTIYDAHRRALAVSLEVETAWADPRQIDDPVATATAVAGVIDVDAEDLAFDLARADRQFVFVARQLDRPKANALRALGLPGIDFVLESKRYYPMRELAAPILGFVGTEHTGLAGLEARYDRVIRGEAGRRTVLRDAHRRNLASPRLTTIAARPGQDLHLTIDSAVQHVVERELAAAVKEYGAARGTVILMDPFSGAIRAMASVPTFDPNRFGDVPPKRWRNPPVMDAYEPGSTFKLVTVAAVLSRDLLGPDDELDCEQGAIVLAGIRIRDHHAFDQLTVREVFARSSNVGAIKMGLLLGDQRLYDAIDAFGFGRPTGIDLPGESAGIVRPPASWTALSKAYISFGQEVSVTAVQLARAFSAVANGGFLVRPHVVSAVASTDEWEDVAAAPIVQGRVLSTEVAAEMRELLRDVVRTGTAKAAGVPGYRVAGKTGTAQKVVGRRYSSRHFVSTFAGMAPVDDPRFVMVVLLDEPWPLYHGGQAAAPTFAAIAGEVLRYWGVGPRLGPELIDGQWWGDEPGPPPMPIDVEPPPEFVTASRPREVGASNQQAFRRREASRSPAEAQR